MDYDRFLNDVGKSRRPSPLRQLHADAQAANLQGNPPILLALGCPCVDTFPVQSISFQLRNGTTITIDESATERCLQYGSSTGIDELVTWLEQIVKEFHNPILMDPSSTQGKGTNTKIVLTNGCQDAISKLFASLITKGDRILIEESVYPGCLSALRPHKAETIPIKTETDGLDVDHLHQILSQWTPEDVRNNSNDIPKLLYVIPTGSNPTGHNLSQAKKERIYKLAQEYNLLIIEDDPYFFHNYEDCSSQSFLSMDTDGRVIRLDSFSKIISPGIRLGYVSGPEAITNVLLYDIQTSSVHVNHLAQVMVLRLLDSWGILGFKEHVKYVCETYRRRRDFCLQAAEKYLKGLADWTVPAGGFFLWIKLRGIKDSYRFVTGRALAKGVLCTPGRGFDSIQPLGSQSSHIRISFSCIDLDQLEQAIILLADAILEETTTTKR